MGYALYVPSSGDYFMIDEENLLGSDTAHLQQSTGWWQNQTGAGGGITLDQTLTAVFGDSHGKVTVSVTNASQGAAIRAERDEVPAAQGDTFSAIAHVASAQAGHFARLRIRFLDVALGTLSTIKGVYVATSDTTFTEHKIENITAPASTAWVSLWIEFSTTDVGDGARLLDDIYYWDAISLVETTSITEFRPRLEIEGTLEEEKEPADLTSDLTSGSHLNVGQVWTGILNNYERRDGVDGPAVTRIIGQDLIDQDIDPGALPFGTQWDDPFGEPWIVQGNDVVLINAFISSVVEFFGTADFEAARVPLPPDQGAPSDVVEGPKAGPSRAKTGDI